MKAVVTVDKDNGYMKMIADVLQKMIVAVMLLRKFIIFVMKT